LAALTFSSKSSTVKAASGRVDSLCASGVHEGPSAAEQQVSYDLIPRLAASTLELRGPDAGAVRRFAQLQP